MVCSSCGHDNGPTARFCSACGASLEKQAPDDATRKTVTVVFTDVAGSTALGERLDPESLREVMQRYFGTAQSMLERHGGTVEKFIGDAVMAVFGVPTVHEDDALRGVRAVIDLREALERLNKELEREQGVRVETRTGVNTGEVIVGAGGAPEDQRLATGDAVNVAARLEQAAAPGEILLGAQTYDAVRDAVVAEPAEPIEAKGKRERVAAWRLLSVRPDVPAFARPIRTPFVGRRAELAELGRSFDTAVRERVCTLATVIGLPGIGKSRLARELIRSVERDARVVIGRCVAYGEGITYLPLAEIVRDVTADDPQQLAELLAGTERGESAARLIAGAIGASDDAGPPEETAWAFRRLLERLAERRPLLVVIDDIHWAESTLLDLLEYIVGFSSGAPIALLCLARPDLFDARPSWSAPRQRATVVSLAPLEDAEAESLVEALDETELSAAARRRIIDSADGNPLFVEQMLAMLADDPEAAADAVPATIHALLASRIDRLEPDERAVLQRGAVEGRLFHRGVVNELLGRSGGSGLGPILLALARKEFVRPDRSTFAGDDAFRFNHVLIRDVAYVSMPKLLRADLHARLAAWLDVHAKDLSARDEIVGYHLEQAYRHATELGRVDSGTRDVALKGGRLLRSAGLRALDRQESAAAAALLDRAAQLLAIDGQERAVLLPDLGRAWREAGDLERAADVLVEAGEDAQQRGDEVTECRARCEQARLTFMQQRIDPDALRAIARRSIEVFERLGSEADLADAWQLMGIAELNAGDRRAHLLAVQQARRHAIASGDLRRQIDAWNEVGGSMLFGRTPVEEVLTFLDEELEWGREHGLASVEADALLGGPYLYSRLGRFGEARERLERSKELCRELGIRYGLAEAHSAGAQMEMLAGDPEAAERELRGAIDVAREMGASRYVSMYRVHLARVLVAQGRDEHASAELEETQDVYGWSPFWLAARALVLARRGAFEEAVAVAREAAAGSSAGDDITQRATILTDVAEVLRAHGDLTGAAEALAEAVALHEEKGNVLPAQRCRELLAALPSPAR